MAGARAPRGCPRDMDPVQILADSGLFRSADRSCLEELRPVLESELGTPGIALAPEGSPAFGWHAQKD